MERNKIINNKVLYTVPIIFIIIIIIRITYVYNDTKQKEFEFAKNEAEVLNSYVMTHRNYYQKFFIDKSIPLNDKTLAALPAFSAYPISEIFSKNNPLNIEVGTVSNRARNPNNMVDESELEAVTYFENNSDKMEYFSGKSEEFYQYGYALKIEQKCLVCHGKKEDAPKFIRDRYSNAYDYKLGEIRGIISIKLPKDILHEYFFKGFINSIIYDLILLFGLFGFIIYLLRKSKNINEFLENEVTAKTNELSSRNSFLNSYIQALDKSAALTKTDPDGIIIYANDKFLQDTGYKKIEVIGKSHKIIKHPDTPDELFVNMWKTIGSKKTWNGIIKGLTKDRKIFISKTTIVPVLDEDGNILEFIAPRTDITELVTNKEKIKHTLVTDSLTSFPNRQKLIDDIKSNKDKDIHIALLNIDSFKDINDFYGHDVADKVLVKLAHKLNQLFDDGIVYKLPSDEYGLSVINNTDKENFINSVKNIIKNINKTKFEVENHSIYITLSCGIASNTNAIMVKADMALQIAKDDKKHIVIYDDSLDISKKITENIQGVALLKEAIEGNNIVPHFQPIFNIHTKKIEKYECLARITQNNGYVIAPIKFLDIALKSKLYSQITRNILTKSFDFFKDKDYEFSINLSIEDIINKHTEKFIIDSLESFNNPSKVVFEILESEKIDNYDELKSFIKKVKKYGCKIAIDDFGSGYSNFAHILELNVDYIKIDASLVKYIATDENSRKITQTIINFAKNLDLKTIAEFVEDKKSLDILEDMGADYIQGYYIGKPSETLNSEV